MLSEPISEWTDELKAHVKKKLSSFISVLLLDIIYAFGTV